MHQDVIPPLSGGRYQLFQVLGSGGMATVYRAYDRSLDIERAIKVLAPDLVARTIIRERFATEARTMAKLHHPNIVSVHDVGSDGDRLFIVMEYLNGGDIHGRLNKVGLYPAKLATYVAKGMLAGLQVAHDKGVTHRDIKPHNVLVSADNIPKVTDFGIAQVSDTNSGLTRTGVVMGTLAYMAPEQRSGAKNVDNRSDIYAVAATLYNMVTGAEPFDLYSSEVREDMLEQVGEPLASIIRKGCSYKKENRYQNCMEMIAAIEAIESDLPEIPADHPPLALPPIDTNETRVPDLPSGSGISVETFDSTLSADATTGPDRQRTDPFAQFQSGSSSFSNDHSQPDSTDAGATFFPIEIDEEEEAVAEASVVREPAPEVAVAPQKSNTGLFVVIGVLAVALLGVGALAMFSLGASGTSNSDVAASALLAAQLEANASIKAEKAEKTTKEILDKVERAVEQANRPGASASEVLSETDQVRQEAKSQLSRVSEVANEAREELKRVVESTPGLRETIDVDSLAELVDLDSEGLEKLLEKLPPSVKAMVKRQWEHEHRVRKLEEALSAIQEQYRVLEERSKASKPSPRASVVSPTPKAVSTPAPPATSAPEPEPSPASAGADAPIGKVILNAKPYSTYYLDGKEVKMVSRKPLEVPAGKHTLVFQDTTSSRRKTLEIVVSSNRTNRFCWSFDEERDFCNE